MRASTCGPASRAATRTSPASCSLNTMSPFFRAATSPGNPRATTPAAAASAWPWWPTPPSARKPPTASPSSSNPSRSKPMTQQLQQIIEAAWEDRANLSPKSHPADVAQAVEHVIAQLNNGQLRVATREGVGQWTVHQWIKKAVLLSFRLKDNEVMRSGDLGFFDKVPTKFAHLSPQDMAATGVRVVPPAVARRGSYIAKGAILMPSYVNIGAYVDEGTMVDTWATVGSCAQIGKGVHLSGGVGIGGVLEPLQANPTIIEDNCFIGARSEVVEGVIVEKEA